MTKELLQQLLSILIKIYNNLEHIPFWKDYVFWISFLNSIFLGVTLYFLIRYTHATEEMAAYQIVPAIEVSMRYNLDTRKTYFWFSNTSNRPGMVQLKHQKNGERIKNTYSSLRVPPNTKMRTADSDFGLSPSDGDKLVLYVSIAPANQETKMQSAFQKSYNFRENQWHESTWSFPDSPFPLA